MGFKLVVVDTTARQAKIDTTLGSPLSDVLREACGKLGRDPSSHGLKHNNKTLDLSNPVRLSGISQNARLELVKLSKSPSIVSVALQIPESENQGVPNSRMTDKFPSSTSLWQILRKFESGAAGGLGLQKNFTARGLPLTVNGDQGAGRLYYETPVIQYMGREVSSFVDLQKSLGRLGFNSGSTLLRLSFRATQDPLEDAMQNIGAYFKSVEEKSSDSKGAHAGSVANTESVPDASQPALTEEDAESRTPPEPVSSPPPAEEPALPRDDDVIASSSITSPTGGRDENQDPQPATSPEPTVTGPDQRPISVYAPPSSTTPLAVQQAYNEKDYVPTIAHAKLHQSRLQSSTHNQRLASYAEDENQQKAKAQKLADTKELKLRIRFPDQSMVESEFTNLDTATTLYECIQGLLRHEDAPFLLKYTAHNGQKEVPKDSRQRLIADLGMVGKMLINFIWEEGASIEARKDPALKEQYAQNAREIQVPNLQDQTEEDERPAPNESQGSGRATGGERKGMPAWMKKTLGKK